MEDTFKHFCEEHNAERFANWIANWGGIAVWNSQMIGDNRQWTTPYRDKHGERSTKPHSYASSRPALVINDPALVGVTYLEEWKRFPVAVRRSSNGLAWKLTDASNRKLNRLLGEAGPGSYYEFDYLAQEAVIMRPTRTISLAQWIAERQAPTQ